MFYKQGARFFQKKQLNTTEFQNAKKTCALIVTENISVEIENSVRLEKFSSSFKLFNFPVFRLGVDVWLDLM
jgi:hypothetical protein